MTENEVVLRVSTKAGRLRLTINPAQTSLGNLRAQVAAKLNVNPDEIALALDSHGSKLLLGDDRKLRHWNLTVDGTEIYAFTNAQPTVQPAAPLTVQTPKPSPSPANNAFSTNKKKPGQNYKTFEEHLEETDFNVSQLPLSQSFVSVRRNLSGPTKLPPAISLKHQVYRHVDHVEVMNVAAISDFVRRWRETDMLCQKAAFLIGYYTEDLHYGQGGIRAVVEALYEPASSRAGDTVPHFDPSSFLNLDNTRLAQTVARGLGLEIIGWVFTHLGRSTLITGAELVRMAKLQLMFLHEGKHYTNYPISSFVTLTISPKESLNGEPGSDAFAVTDLGLAMVRDNVIEDPDLTRGIPQDFNEEHESDKYICIRQPHDRNELIATVLESTKEVQKLDTDWLLVRLAESAPKEIRLLLCRNTFPPANVAFATFEDVAKFLRTAPPQLTESYEKLADFHFILFVAETLGYESAEQIIQAVRTKSDISADFYTLLNSLA